MTITESQSTATAGPTVGIAEVGFEKPLRSEPSKPFPGWTMVGISAAAQFMSAPGQSYSVAAFRVPMRETLQVSETNYSLAYALATVVSGCILPWTGRQIDRYGARRALPITAFLLTIACLVMAKVTTLAGLLVGFTLIRCIGQGALWLIGIWIASEWFLRRRGFATAISGLGGSLSVVLFPLLNHYLIEHIGWQAAWIVLGVMVSATLILPSIWLLRDRPEDIGWLPDGDRPQLQTDLPPGLPSTQNEEVMKVPHAAGTRPTAPTSLSWPRIRVSRRVVPTEESWTLREVLLDRTFWKLVSVSVCSGMIGTGIVFHQVSLLADRGLSEKMALGLISFQAVVASTAAVGAGWLTDRFRAEWLLAVAMLLLASSVLVIGVMPTPGFGLIFAALMGLHGSILRSAGTVVWVNYYGRQNQGVIRGAAMSAMILAAAIGPLPLAVAIDQLGTYRPAIAAYVILPLLSMLWVLSAKQPRRPIVGSIALP